MTIASNSRVRVYIADDAQGKSLVFMRLKYFLLPCTKFLILNHKEYIIFHIKFGIEIFVRKSKS
jgi:hypothetical protein